MELILALLALGYVVFKLSALASQPRERVVLEPKEEKVVVPKPVPLPSRAEQAAAAKARYDETLRMIAAAAMDDIERDAAKEKAKQAYLKEMDGVI